jgi:hypothetical protein
VSDDGKTSATRQLILGSLSEDNGFKAFAAAPRQTATKVRATAQSYFAEESLLEGESSLSRSCK